MITVTTPISYLPAEFRPLRRTEYDQLIELGVFEGTRVELVGGVLVEMSPQGPEHAGLLIDMNMRLVMAAHGRSVVNPSGPVLVDDISEPEPDFAIQLKGEYRRIGKIHDALFIIEVSNTSLGFDLGEKSRRYAMAGYPEYWVLDVAARCVHVHTAPQPDGSWGSIVILDGGVLASTGAPGISLDLDDLLDF